MGPSLTIHILKRSPEQIEVVDIFRDLCGSRHRSRSIEGGCEKPYGVQLGVIHTKPPRAQGARLES